MEAFAESCRCSTFSTNRDVRPQAAELRLCREECRLLFIFQVIWSRTQGLVSPQDYISMLVWNYKKNAISVNNGSYLLSSDNGRKMESGLLGSNDASNEEDKEECMTEAQI